MVVALGSSVLLLRGDREPNRELRRSVTLVHPFGVEGVILGTIVAQALAFPPLLWFFFREFSVATMDWGSGSILAPSLPGLAIQAATAYPLLLVAERFTNLGMIALLGIMSVGLLIAGFLLIGLSREQRALLLSTMRDAVRRRETASREAAESLSR